MKIETLMIGDELLDGRVTDTNSVRLASALKLAGFKLSGRTTVIDDLEDIVRAASEIARRGTKLCVVAGGLGPTDDDLTSEAFANLMSVGLKEDQSVVAKLRSIFEARGREMTPNQLRQAQRPDGSTLLDNPVGSAPGFSLQHEGCTFMALPGVPREFDVLVENHVIPHVVGQGTKLHRRILRSFGLIEGVVEEKLRPILEGQSSVRVGYRAHFPEIEVSLSADSDSDSLLDEVALRCEKELAPHVFSKEPGPFAATLVLLLRERSETIAVAESCTGGLIGDLLTDVVGSSSVFQGGVQAYSNEVKREKLNVSMETLERVGAVSEETVQEMAEGVRASFKSDWAVAVSGIAGPGGGTDAKPVGTVWIAVAGPGKLQTKCLRLPYGRRRNKIASAHAALDLTRQMVLA